MIKLTKLSTYYVSSGGKTIRVLNVTIRPLYIINATHKTAQYSPTYMGSQRRFQPHGTFEGTLGTLGQNEPSQCASSAKGISYGFGIMKIGPCVSKVCPGQIWSIWVFFLGSKGTHLNKVPVCLKKQVFCESSGFIYIR